MRAPGHRRCRSAALGVAAFVALGLVSGAAIALLLAPAAVLFCLLVLGVHPGEHAIERLRDRRRRPRAHRAPRMLATRRRPIVVPRTSWLTASPLAMRPPPALAPPRA